jgi:hypothetical protein
MMIISFNSVIVPGNAVSLRSMNKAFTTYEKANLVKPK